jgi:hypothetical protein
MGMNLYTLRGIHIGKRSAGGIWCWDCKNYVGTADKCFLCLNKTPANVGYNAAFRELGFDKSEPKKHRGIDGASVFTFEVGTPLGDTIEQVKASLRDRKFVMTEYGERWPMSKFWKMFDDVIKVEQEEGEFS